MGELVSLCEYRNNLRKQEEARSQEQLDLLKEWVKEAIKHLGEPDIEPYFLPLDDHLTEDP